MPNFREPRMKKPEPVNYKKIRKKIKILLNLFVYFKRNIYKLKFIFKKQFYFYLKILID